MTTPIPGVAQGDRGDDAVARGLRSGASLVVVEAPAGCGKTYQGSVYAAEMGRPGGPRVLVLTHTHAAANEFASRAAESRARVDVRTIDSLVVEIASAYHRSLDLPEDVGYWASRRNERFAEVARLVARLIAVTRGPGRALVQRYPIVIFDEHQDTSEAQGALLDAVVGAGGRVRVFGDPLQVIFPDAGVETEWDRWNRLCARADLHLALVTPHRWADSNPELGDWIFEARQSLLRGEPIDLMRDRPRGLEVHRADNKSPRYGMYQTTTEDGRPIRRLAREPSVLVLSAQNSTVNSLRSYFGRRLPIWEGHTRYLLGDLVSDLETADGQASAVAEAFVRFVQAVAVGFTTNGFGDRVIQEAREGCVKKTWGKPEKLQEIARALMDSPDHCGVAHALKLLWKFSREEAAFKEVRVDRTTEYWDAVRLADFEDPENGVSTIAQRRTQRRPSIPNRALSTIHKAKGLERSCVMIMPCDAKHFPDSPKGRCLLYVALSRASDRLVLVVPNSNPSSLLAVD